MFVSERAQNSSNRVNEVKLKTKFDKIEFSCAKSIFKLCTEKIAFYAINI